jgi:hypothetical protein
MAGEEQIPNRVYEFEWATARGFGGPDDADRDEWFVFLVIRREEGTESFVFTRDQAERLVERLTAQIAVIDAAQPG